MPKSVQIVIEYKDGRKAKVLFNEERLIGDCSSYNIGGVSHNLEKCNTTKKELDAALAYVYINSDKRWVKLIGTHRDAGTSTGSFFDVFKAKRFPVQDWVGQHNFCISIVEITPEMRVNTLSGVEKIVSIVGRNNIIVYGH